MKRLILVFLFAFSLLKTSPAQDSTKWQIGINFGGVLIDRFGLSGTTSNQALNNNYKSYIYEYRVGYSANFSINQKLTDRSFINYNIGYKEPSFMFYEQWGFTTGYSPFISKINLNCINISSIYFYKPFINEKLHFGLGINYLNNFNTNSKGYNYYKTYFLPNSNFGKSPFFMVNHSFYLITSISNRIQINKNFILQPSTNFGIGLSGRWIYNADISLFYTL